MLCNRQERDYYSTFSGTKQRNPAGARFRDEDDGRDSDLQTPEGEMLATAWSILRHFSAPKRIALPVEPPGRGISLDSMDSDAGSPWLACRAEGLNPCPAPRAGGPFA